MVPRKAGLLVACWVDEAQRPVVLPRRDEAAASAAQGVAAEARQRKEELRAVVERRVPAASRQVEPVARVARLVVVEASRLFVS